MSDKADIGSSRNVYLVGNPNCGKTSLFNALTGERRQVGNWPGVTVQKIEGVTRVGDLSLLINDLPGTYSLTPATPEEEVVLKTLDEAASGVIINVVDIANFERNLFLTTQLLELGVNPVISLNCFDSFTRAGGSIDLLKFTSFTALHAFPTVARTGEGVNSLIEHLARPDSLAADCCANLLALPETWKTAADEVLVRQNLRWENATPLQKYDALRELISLKPLESSPEVQDIRRRLATQLSIGREKPLKVIDLACELASDRYRRIEKLIAACAQIPGKNIPAWQEKLDGLMTHRFLALPIFALLMAWVFYTTFSLGEIPMGWMHALLDWAGDFVKAHLQPGLLRELITEGIIHGVGGVLVFIPNILILFFWIAILEDSGYMSRAAFIMDRIMNGIGLHGRAFIPMIMGLGCNVPAVLATRIIDNRFQRLLTMLLIPLVTCAARLPVLVLLCGTFFPENPSIWMFSLFFVNLIVLVFLGHLTSILFRSSDNSPFLLEMPPYRLPTPASVLHMLHEKAMHFIEKAGTVILAGAILIWVLSVFPREVPLSFDYQAELAVLNSQPAGATTAGQIAALQHRREIEQMEGRYMARIGKFLHPVMAPLGFSWRETVSLIPGFLAKESVVSTLTVLYLPYDDDLGVGMRKTGMTPLVAFVFMLFTLLYIPCIATLGVVWRESGSTRFTALAMLVYLAIAYLVSYAALKIGETINSQTSAVETITIILAACGAGWYLLRCLLNAFVGRKCKTCTSCSACPNKSSNCSGG
ncbi:MAG TPA: ferrous iron transport protein B [Candidatus Rifleibacterium sp.]|nr:ferrous iron transport protein B [Candidatus Rifleibacterium sp.]